jgi:crotonobetainyl-CoA:carnitine CoA-transferase CaiB-like acyl-CoA transferase
VDRAPETNATAALGGLRVVDLTTTVPGAQATQLLADFGAEVVLVEPPGGSPLRAEPAWPVWLRGKESIELDLHDATDREVARDLCRRADVIVETWRPGVAERLGLGYEQLRLDNPGLVYGSLTGFGRTGPLAGLQGYEGIVMAKIGGYGQLRLTDRPGPSFCAVPATGFNATQTLLHGLLAALYERESSGLGQRVDTSMLAAQTAHDCWNWLVQLIAARYSEAYTAVARVDEARRVPNGPLSFRLIVGLSQDGRWLQFSQTSQRLWVEFMRVLGLEWMLTDPEWADAPSSESIDKREDLWERMLRVIRTKTVAEWYEIFDARPDVFAEVFRQGTELLDHPQLLHDGLVVSVDDPKLGPVRQPGPLVKMSATPGVLDRPAPAVDEHGGHVRGRARPAAAGGVPDRSAAAIHELGAPALQGVTVVELGSYYAGPFGSTVLTDYGARVIKVEQLDGDPMRWIMPFPESGGVKVLSGKESLAVDIGTPEGRDIVHELVRRADAVLCSFRAGVAERLGYDSASLLAVNPDLVYLNAPGFGTDGPYGHRPAYAPTIGAGSGQAGRNLGPTMVQRPDLSLQEVKNLSLRLGGAAMTGNNPDASSALAVATGLFLGLLARKRGAPGQAMLTTMLHTMGHVLSEDMVDYEGRAPAPTVDSRILGFGPLYRLYETADGWVFLAAPRPAEWTRLAGALPGDWSDRRFSTSEERAAHPDELGEALEAVFLTRSAAEWEDALNGVDVACAVVADGPPETTIMGPGGLGRALDLVADLHHPVCDDYPRMKPLATLSRSKGATPGAPLLGADTYRILRELGYEDGKIQDLRTRGVTVEL